MLQSALHRHTVLPRAPHLIQRQTDIHVPVVKLISLLDGKRNQFGILPESIPGEREQERTVLVSLILLLLRLGAWGRSRGRCGWLLISAIRAIGMLRMEGGVWVLWKTRHVVFGIIVVIVVSNGYGSVGPG